MRPSWKKISMIAEEKTKEESADPRRHIIMNVFDLLFLTDDYCGKSGGHFIIKTDMTKEKLIKYLINKSDYDIGLNELNKIKQCNSQCFSISVSKEQLSDYLLRFGKKEFLEKLIEIKKYGGVIVHSEKARDLILKKYGIDYSDLPKIEESLRKGDWKIYNHPRK